jgi:hypothetical protein
MTTFHYGVTLHQLRFDAKALEVSGQELLAGNSSQHSDPTCSLSGVLAPVVLAWQQAKSSSS